MKMKRYAPIILIFFVFSLLIQSVAAENMVIVDFYYSAGCGSCMRDYVPIFNATERHYKANYSGKVIFHWKEVGANATNNKEMRARGLNFPSVIVNNHTKIFKANLTYVYLRQVIDATIKNLSINQTPWWIIPFPFIRQINVSGLSLPVLTIVLGGLDSMNPCSFFILIFLLNLLVYLQSKRRMLLVGGIFIFFSGLFYAIFMIMLYLGLVFLSTYVTFVSVIAGVVAVLLGILNIKDFFFFKQGPTLSIPDDKQKETFHRIRKIVKSPSLLMMLTGTIILSITVNLYELLCTLIYPWVYVNVLRLENLPFIERVVPSIISYCIVYVIPLLIIVFLFAFTLGTRKISEWQGRQLKLLSGVMIFSFGLCFIIDYQLLENLFTPLGLFGFSILLTLLVSYIWKRYKKEPEEPQQQEEQKEESNITKKYYVSELLQQERFDDAWKTAKEIKLRKMKKESLTSINKRYIEMLDDKILPFLSSLEKKGVDISKYQKFVKKSKRKKKYYNGAENYISEIMKMVDEKKR